MIRDLFFVLILVLLSSCAAHNVTKGTGLSSPPPPKPALIEKAVYKVSVNKELGYNLYLLQIMQVLEVGRGVPLLSDGDTIKVYSDYNFEIKKSYKILVSPPKPIMDGENDVWGLLKIINE